MFLGIEIGGTKLQFGVARQAGTDFIDFRREQVDPRQGAEGILQQMATVGRELIDQHGVQRLGVGFGGPVDRPAGLTVISHQISGWEKFPLVDWCRRHLGVPAVLGNDCDVATLAEALYGAGRGQRAVFFVTVGTGVGGGFVIDGRMMGEGRPAIAEIGHLRPGLTAIDPHDTVEARASGWGITAAVRKALADSPSARDPDRQDLLSRCDGDPDRLTAVHVAVAAREGNSLAHRAIDDACRALGWGVSQVITLLAPQVVVVGGGVSLIGEAHFFRPLREYVHQYVFPPLRDSYEIVPARLGENVVVHGALTLAATT
jgi:glucokinase